jgi:hypothetical protein
MGSAISRKQAQLQKQQQTLETEHQEYHQSIHKLSQAIHPFHIETCESQMGLELSKTLKEPLATLERLSQSHAPNKSQDALERWNKQIPNLSGTIHAWWHWTIQSLKAQTQANPKDSATSTQAGLPPSFSKG